MRNKRFNRFFTKEAGIGRTSPVIGSDPFAIPPPFAPRLRINAGTPPKAVRYSKLNLGPLAFATGHSSDFNAAREREGLMRVDWLKVAAWLGIGVMGLAFWAFVLWEAL